MYTLFYVSLCYLNVWPMAMGPENFVVFRELKNKTTPTSASEAKRGHGSDDLFSSLTAYRCLKDICPFLRSTWSP